MLVMLQGANIICMFMYMWEISEWRKQVAMWDKSLTLMTGITSVDDYNSIITYI